MATGADALVGDADTTNEPANGSTTVDGKAVEAEGVGLLEPDASDDGGDETKATEDEASASRSAKDGPRLLKCFLYIRSYCAEAPEAVMGVIPDMSWMYSEVVSGWQRDGGAKR